MGKNTTQVTARMPESLKQEVEEVAEERGMSRSATVKQLVRDGMEREEVETELAAAKATSALTLLGVVSIVLAPTLLAVGVTLPGVFLSIVAATYTLLWVTGYDSKISEHVAAARRELSEGGGFYGFFKLFVADAKREYSEANNVVGFVKVVWKKWKGSHDIQDPDSPVERAARVDLYIPIVAVVFFLVSLPALGAVMLGEVEAFVGLFDSTSALIYLLLTFGTAYSMVILLGISAVASIALVSARSEDPSSDPVKA